ncbi:MAG: hypothetical protein NW200_07060 [Hyphomonadaceae bacterium]|nr:hypothetical protein [Hyphomonadaceae bacterium]
MKNTMRLLAAAGAASMMWAVLGAGVAAADPPRSVTIGQTVSGTLANRDAKAENGTPYDDHLVRLTADQGLEALMSSSDFDAFLRVGRGVGDEFEELKSDDDGGGGRDARVRFSAPEDGVYTVRANALSQEMRGAYSLRLSAYTPPPPPVTRPLAIDAPASGDLADGGPRLDEGDRLYAQYSFTGAAGDRLKIETNAAAFDSVLQLGRMVDGAFEELKSDDDGAGERNARILTVLEEPGEHIVRVVGFDADSKGPYTVSLTRLPPPAPAPRPKAIRIGEVQRGMFTTSSATFDEFRPYEYFRLTGRKGQTATIIMRADFDAFLDVGVMSPGGYAILKSDDDGAGQTNAKIDFTFEESGAVLIRTSPLHGGAVGGYTLTVE